MAAKKEKSPYPELGDRAAAFFIDFILALALSLAISVPLAGGQAAEKHIAWTVLALYFAVFPATPLQGTPGKRLLGLRVADTKGARIGLVRAIVRFLASVPSIALGFIGVLAMDWTPRRQALHDLVAGTIVVRRRASLEAIAERPPPVSWLSRIGNFLVLGGLAAIFSMAYVALRANQVKEHLWAATTQGIVYQDEVAKALQSGKPPPPPTGKVSRHVKSMAARPDETIVIELDEALFPGGRITYRPVMNARGEVMWTCAAENVKSGMLPSSCR